MSEENVNRQGLQKKGQWKKNEICVLLVYDKWAQTFFEILLKGDKYMDERRNRHVYIQCVEAIVICPQRLYSVYSAWELQHTVYVYYIFRLFHVQVPVNTRLGKLGYSEARKKHLCVCVCVCVVENWFFFVFVRQRGTGNQPMVQVRQGCQGDRLMIRATTEELAWQTRKRDCLCVRKRRERE